MDNNRSNKKSYNTLKLLTKRNQKKTMIILDKDDTPIAEHGAVTNVGQNTVTNYTTIQ